MNCDMIVLTAAVLTLCMMVICEGQVLTPPYFNLAENSRVVASATCGEGVPEPELFCKLVGASEGDSENLVIQGQVCDFCDPNRPDQRHPAEFAVDSVKDTWWQSPPLSRGMKYNEINVTIDLGQEFHVAYVLLKMGNSPRPMVWILERSNDNGQTYSPWQYFADTAGECQVNFGSDISLRATADDTVICDTQFSKIVPLEGGEIIVPLVQNRPSANDFFNSTVLQEWTRATNVRFRFLKVKTLLGHLMSVAKKDPTTTRRYFYSIKDVIVGGRCRCNGHAETCDIQDPNDTYKRICNCRHFTCGHNCEVCCPGFEQKKWRQSKSNIPFECERCNCFGHTNECFYNETVDALRLSLDMQGNYEGGGVCQNCEHNTHGVNCDKCVDGFYRPFHKMLNETDVCQPCACNLRHFTGNCYEGTGQCECKPEFQKPNCDACSPGHYGYPNCKPCECFINGTRSNQCESDQGQCPCRLNYGGKFCKFCADGYFNFPECKPCNCNPIGSSMDICDINTGNCKCQGNYGNRTCDQCNNGYYGFPQCSYCNCDAKGTLPELCDKGDGKCLCKPGYGGVRCDQCVANFTGFPDCHPCGCSKVGSAFAVCDINGKCTCLPNYAGKLCDQCAPGFYRYPECLRCNCSSHGTNGVTCNNEGICQCLPNFDGPNCSKCREGYYNYPVCEECNFNPAGVVSSFVSCNNLQPGELMKCKSHVQGRLCSTCKELYWNLQARNPDGCQDCDCHTEGTVGRLASCNETTGQCICKAAVTSRQCKQCADGFYGLRDNDLFGCKDCNCDIGGAVSSVCDKRSGQCMCQPRVTGRTCNKPMQTHYFPTLHHYQYEVEEGRTPTSSPIRYDFDESVFPGYSWKGYAVFSHLQNETLHPIMIDKSSIYRVIVRYINPNPQTVTSTVSIMPEDQNNVDTEQKFHVLLKPSRSPVFATVAGIGGNIPSPFVLNPGPWILKITNQNSVFMDYFVLLPSEYYEADLLVSSVSKSCTIGDKSLCRHYEYSPVEVFDRTLGKESYKPDGDNRAPVDSYFENIREYGNPKIPMISEDQPELAFDLRISKPGKHVVVVTYVTIPDQNTTTLEVEVKNNNDLKAALTVYSCRYSIPCRGVVTDGEGKVTVFYFSDTSASVIFKGPTAKAGIESTVAIPLEKWSSDLIQPKPSCVRINSECVVQEYSDNSNKNGSFDQTGIFISECGKNHFFLNTSEGAFSDYCKAAAFSLTAKHMHGALFCQCDYDGATSFECDPFGGQCPCKENVIGRRCDICKTGHYGFPNCKPCVCPMAGLCDPVTGECSCPTNVEGEFCNQCMPYTFGYHPVIGCEDCNCNIFGVKDGNLQCNLYDGTCMCKENIEGRTCDRCIAGFWAFPECRKCECDLRGTEAEICNQTLGNCYCKSNVQGAACDVCKDGTFNLQSGNELGCTKCFCFGKTSRCSSSTLFTSVIRELHNWTLLNVNSSGKALKVEPLSISPEEFENGVDANMKYIVGGMTYFSAPPKYLGNKLPSYGGFLNYSILFEKFDEGNMVSGPDVIIRGGGNDLTFISLEQPDSGTEFFVSVNMVESSFGMGMAGTPITREQLMVTLHNLTSLYLRASYSDKGSDCHLSNVALEVAVPEYDPSSDVALAVEQCSCPPGYVGLSCEDCANGYYRAASGPFGGYCAPCQCNGHATTCDKITGICHDCKHSTKGDHCEKCDLGFYGNATAGTPNDCLICACPLPLSGNNFAKGCDINEAGDKILCNCFLGYSGDQCDGCAPGFFGRPDVIGDSCKACQCNGNIMANESNACDPISGKCLRCLNNTYGDSCEKCSPGYFGDAVVQKNCQSCICDKCGTQICDHNSGQCWCRDNIVGEKCDRCDFEHYGYSTCQGCRKCNCQEASKSLQCDDITGNCMCKDGVVGRSCDRCAPGYWKYSKDGCESCGCNTGYSVGVGCNVTTGKCECLPGVVGEKCDMCPPRWVLVPNDGCFECDGCQHGLLDVTDAMSAELSPVYNQFQTIAVGYFTSQRLIYINNTVDELRPNITDILSHQIHLTPYIVNITNLENEVEGIFRNVKSVYNDALNSATKGDLSLAQAMAVLDEVNRAVDKAQGTVYEINTLAYNLESGSGAQVDYAVKEAQRLLDEIQESQLDEERKTLATENAGKAKELLKKIREFAAPLGATVTGLEGLNKKMNAFEGKVDELQGFSEKAGKMATDVESVNRNVRQSMLKERLKSMEGVNEETNSTLRMGSELLANLTHLLEMAQGDFESLAGKTASLKEKNGASNDSRSAYEDANALKNGVYDAMQRANDLEDRAKDLDLLKRKSLSSSNAVQAANAYKNIVDALEGALNASNQAETAAQNAITQSENLSAKVSEARKKSSDLRDKAGDLFTDVQKSLAPLLTATIQREASVLAFTNDLGKEAEALAANLRDLSRENEVEDILSSLKPDEAAGAAIKPANEVKNTVNDLPKKLDDARELYKGLDRQKKDVNQAKNHLDKVVEDFPKLKESLGRMKNEPSKWDEKNENVKKMMDDLKNKISMTRDIAEGIKVGMKIKDSGASVALRVPRSVSQRGSSTDISLYFKTADTNALLLYMGNEMPKQRRRRESKIRRQKSDDFLMLELKNGFPVFTVDLGGGVKDIHNDKFVADNRWYQVKILRTGRSVNFTIIEEGGDGKTASTWTKEYTLPGYYNVFNLDQERAHLFVGGFPPDYASSAIVKQPSFLGEIQDLTINGHPIGLWNFKNISTLNPTWDKMEAVDGSKDRPQVSKIMPSSAFKFDGEGYMIISSLGYQFKEASDVSLRFKTASPDGLIFLSVKENHYLSIELRTGFIFYQFDVGAGLIEISSEKSYNDDAWHKIEVSRQNNNGNLKIDGVLEKERSNPQTDLPLKISDEFYIGGYPGNEKIPAVKKIPFQGCIDELLIGSTVVDLNKNVNVHGAVPGCTDEMANSVSFEASGGYLKWNSNVMDNFVDLALRFKTKSPDGLIAYAMEGDSAFYLLLADGGLVLKSGGQEVTTGANKRYNDNVWHTVMAVHNTDSSLVLIVDDIDEFKSVGPPKPIRFLHGLLYFGHVPSSVDATAAIEKGFVGCIGDVTLNTAVVNFANATEAPGATIGKCYGPPRTKPPVEVVETTTTAPTTTFSPDKLESGVYVDKGGYIKAYEHFNVGLNMIVKMSVKPKSRNGLLMSVHNSRRGDHFVLQLVEGQVIFIVDSGNGPVQSAYKPNTPNGISDGKWHTIEAVKKKNLLILTVDGNLVNPTIDFGLSRKAIMNHPLYIGGHPNPEKYSSIVKEAVQFVGCINNVEINGKEENFTLFTSYGSVLFKGCPIN